MKPATGTSLKIAEFKAQLSRHLHAVRGGASLVIMDRQTPIARVEPYRASTSRLVVREALRKWGTTVIPPAPRKKTNSLKYLLEDRDRYR